MVARGLHHAHDDLADLDLLQAGVVALGDQLGHPSAHLRLVELVRLLADPDGEGGRLVALPVADGEEELEQAVLHRRADPGHHPQVEDGDVRAVGEEDVAGMGIGVEEPVDEDLLHVGLEELLGQIRPVDLEPGERADRGDLAPADVVHGQHARRRVVLDGERDDDPLELGQVAAERHEVLRLEPVVQLAREALPELIEDRLEPVVAADLGVGVEELGDRRQRLDVLGDALPDAGPLHLHRHLAAVAEPRAMHLAERGRGQRGRVELREALREPDTELARDDLLDLGERKRRDVVLEAAQRLDVRGGQDVGARREELAELDEGGAHLLEVVGKG
jgi:hypothetical protein